MAITTNFRGPIKMSFLNVCLYFVAYITRVFDGGETASPLIPLQYNIRWRDLYRNWISTVFIINTGTMDTASVSRNEVTDIALSGGPRFRLVRYIIYCYYITLIMRPSKRPTFIIF